MSGESVNSTPNTQETTQESADNEVFKSPEQAQELKDAFAKMFEAGTDAGAAMPLRRNIHNLTWDFDPRGIDPDNGRPGVMVEKRIPVPDPEGFKTTEWRTYTDAEKKTAYRWSISANEAGQTMVTLETPVDRGFGNFEDAIAASKGIIVQGRRLQDFIVADDGTVNVRTADFSVVGPSYRTTGRQAEGQATVAQINFLRENLAKAELVLPTYSESAPVTASDVAPNLAQAA